MSKARLIALAGPLTILAGSLWVAAFIGNLLLLVGLASVDTFWDEFWLFTFSFSFVPLLFALIGTRLRFHQAAGVPGNLGLALGAAGCAGWIVSMLAYTLLSRVAPEVVERPGLNYAAQLCFLGFMTGYILFGVDALRFRLLPRWNLLPLLAGSTILFGFATTLFGVPGDHPLQLLPFFITGACWVLLGLALMYPRRQPQPAE
jgi:hypothetical protein